MLKSTGIVRNTDPLGRIVLPVELRRTMELKPNDPLEIFVDGDAIMLKPYRPGCTFCGKTERHEMKSFCGHTICDDCTKKLKEALR